MPESQVRSLPEACFASYSPGNQDSHLPRRTERLDRVDVYELFTSLEAELDREATQRIKMILEAKPGKETHIAYAFLALEVDKMKAKVAAVLAL